MTFTWENDAEFFALAKRQLYTAVVGDIMDQMGLQRQFLPPEIKPLQQDMTVIGRAMTVLEADIDPSSAAAAADPLQPFGLMLRALDDLKPNEIYLCTGASPNYALWGELMSRRAMILGAAGAVMNGYSRDTREILRLGFPTFSIGRYAQDQAPRGRVVDFRTPLRIGQLRVEPGDIVFGDMDGVCVIPRRAEQEVFAAALEKAAGEKTVAKAIAGGMSAAEAFARYHIL